MSDMDNLDDLKHQILQKALQTINLARKSATTKFEVDLSLPDDDVKEALETFLATIDETTADLMNRVKDVTALSDQMKALAESITSVDERNRAGQLYIQTMQDPNGSVTCLTEAEAELKRLEDEDNLMRRQLTAINTRIDAQASAGGNGMPLSSKALAILPSLRDLVPQPMASQPPPSYNTSSSIPTRSSPSTPHPPNGSARPSDMSYMYAALPKATLPMYNGDLTSFVQFWDSFTALVDNVPHIPEVSKLNILMSCLTGPAKDAVSGFSITRENYEIVKDILSSRFGNRNTLLRRLYDELDVLPRAKENVRSARATFNATERILRLLENQKEDINHRSMILQVERKLPDLILNDIADLKLYYDDKWSMPILRKVVSQKLALREEIADIGKMRSGYSSSSQYNDVPRSDYQTNYGNYYDRYEQHQHENNGNYDNQLNHQKANNGSYYRYVQHQREDDRNDGSNGNYDYSRGHEQRDDNQNSGNEMRPSAAFFVSNKDETLSSEPARKMCAFCGLQSHFSDQCREYSSVLSRKQKALHDKLCFSCLRIGHTARQCQSKKACYFCRKPGHHSSLCFSNDPTDSPNVSVNSGSAFEELCGGQRESDTNVEVVSGLTTNDNVSEQHNVVTEIEVAPIPEWSFMTVNNEPTITARHEVALFTCKNNIRDPRTKVAKDAVVLADEGSMISIISEQCAKSLGLRPTRQTTCCIGTMTSGTAEPEVKNVYTVDLKCIDGTDLRLQLVEYPSIPLKRVALVQNGLEIQRDMRANASVSLANERAQILIGADLLVYLKKSLVREFESGCAVYRSLIGYGIMGPLPDARSSVMLQLTPAKVSGENVTFRQSNFDKQKCEETNRLLECLWQSENVDISHKEAYVSDDNQELQKFVDSVKFPPDKKRNQVKFPFNEDQPGVLFDRRLASKTSIYTEFSGGNEWLAKACFVKQNNLPELNLREWGGCGGSNPP